MGTKLIVMGDFNAKIGKREDWEERTVGQFGSGERNDRGDRLIEFSTSNNLKIMNSFYKKPASRKWTWRSPDGKTKNAIDFILTDSPHIFRDVKIITKVNVGSDHRMVMGKIKINTRRERQKLLKQKTASINVEKLTEQRVEFQIQLKNQFQLLADECQENRTLESWNDQIIKTTQETAEKVAGKKVKTQETKISDSTRSLMDKRRRMKAEGTNVQRIEYTETCKTIRKKLREDIRNYNTRMIKSTIEENRSLKKTYKKLAQGKQKITSLFDKDGHEITDQDLILKRIEEFYEDLYASDKDTEEPGEPQEEIPNVTDWEVQHAVKQMKKGKSPGPDNVLIDTVREGGDVLAKELAKLFSMCMHKGRVPNQWKEASMIILHKKGDKRDLKNYRPISLLSNLYKLYTRILTNRLQNILDDNQPREQAGFRKGFSTMDHIHSINQLKEKCQEYNIPLCIAFIDYEKAFDSVETCAVLGALKEQGINNAYLKIFKDIYSDCYNTVKLHKTSDKINIKKGVRQGDTTHQNSSQQLLKESSKHLTGTKKAFA